MDKKPKQDTLRIQIYGPNAIKEILEMQRNYYRFDTQINQIRKKVCKNIIKNEKSHQATI